MERLVEPERTDEGCGSWRRHRTVWAQGKQDAASRWAPTCVVRPGTDLVGKTRALGATDDGACTSTARTSRRGGKGGSVVQPIRPSTRSGTSPSVSSTPTADSTVLSTAAG